MRHATCRHWRSANRRTRSTTPSRREQSQARGPGNAITAQNEEYRRRAQPDDCRGRQKQWISGSWKKGRSGSHLPPRIAHARSQYTISSTHNNRPSGCVMYSVA
jgi:hypothetical protein